MLCQAMFPQAMFPQAMLSLTMLSLTMLSLTMLALACTPGEAPVERQPPGAPLAGAAAPLVRLDTAGAGSTTDAGAVDAGAGVDAAGVEAPGPPSNDCCTESGSGGCNDEAVEACVCAGDAFCCAVEYDALCANQAVSRCGIDCDERPPVSDCCAPSDVPGCTRPEVAACICDIDPFCCVFRFDQNCVNLGVSRCGAACEKDVP
jgi:hypothetical protein